MAKRKRKPKTQLIDEDGNVVHVSSYEITYEPIHDRKYKRLPQKVKDALERLHYESQKNPRKAIPELEEWLKKYPQIPMFYNYLSVAYSRIGDDKKVEEIIEQNVRKNPDYLFARLNYAELFMARGEYEKVAEIFDYKFDLKMLYPQRKRFHISEVANFMALVGIYFYEIGEREAAEKYYEILQQIAPSYLMTKMLKSRLKPGIFLRIMRRLSDALDREENE